MNYNNFLRPDATNCRCTAREKIEIQMENVNQNTLSTRTKGTSSFHQTKHRDNKERYSVNCNVKMRTYRRKSKCIESNW